MSKFVGESSSRRNSSNPDCCCCLRTHGDTTPMEQKLWSQLPRQLLFLILARLPVISFIRARSVCTTWNSLMYAPHFLELCSQVPPSRRFGAVQYYKKAKMIEFYDHPKSLRCNNLQQKKYQITLSFLPSDSATLVASGGGLLCFSKKNFAEQAMLWWVCNPVTKEWRELPRKENVVGGPLVHIEVKRNPFTYKVIVYWVDTRTVQEYDSVACTWSLDSLLDGASDVCSQFVRNLFVGRTFPQLELRIDGSP